MDLSYIDQTLHFEEVSLETLADEFDTPLYVYNQPALMRAAQAMDLALVGRTPHLICYAVKANPSLAIIQAFAQQGFGADVTSGGELHRALKAGIRPECIVFSGVGKTATEVRLGLEAGIRAFHIESAWELEMIQHKAEISSAIVPLALRVNPDVDAHTHPSITTGIHETKFGIAWEAIPELVAAIQSTPSIQLVGLSMHIGSQITEIEPFREAAGRLAGLARDLLNNGIELGYLDFGGGLGARYLNETPPSFAEWGQTLRQVLGDLPLELVVEPGRALIAEMGVLITRVLGIKQTPRKTFVITDAGMTDLIRPMLYGAYHPIWPVRQRQDAPEKIVDVVGPVCETTDTLAKDRALPLSEPGDLLAILHVGAYGAAMASNYNSRPRAAEVMVKQDGSAQLIRSRETYEDMTRNEFMLQ